MNCKNILITILFLAGCELLYASGTGGAGTGQPGMTALMSGSSYIAQDKSIKSTYSNSGVDAYGYMYNQIHKDNHDIIVRPENKSVLGLVAGKLVADGDKPLTTLAGQRMIKFSDNDIDNRVGHVVWPIHELVAAAGLKEDDNKRAFLVPFNSRAMAEMMKAVAISGGVTAEQGVKFRGLAQDIEDGYIDLVKPALAAQPGYIDIKFGSSLLNQPATVEWNAISK